MEDPLLDQLLADAESLLSESGLSNAQAAAAALGAESQDLEIEREDRLRVALIAELDRRHGAEVADPEASSRAAEEWADRGDAGSDDTRQT